MKKETYKTARNSILKELEEIKNFICSIIDEAEELKDTESVELWNHRLALILDAYFNF